MAASVFDSPLTGHLFPTGEAGRLFSDSAAVRAMLLVEGALARAQGKAGLIPETSAAAIHRATLEIQIDPGALAKSTGSNGVCVPGLVEAFRAEMSAPEHSQYVHWGATSQDILDTGLMLRLRQALLLAEADLKTIVQTLAQAAETHAGTPMAGRTYGQVATPTSWGAVLAGFGGPLLDALAALPALRDNALWVSLSGAAGTSSALGSDPAALRQALAEGLGLNDPKRSWHTDRGPLLRITDWMGQVSAALGTMAETLVALNATEVGELALSGAGSSSTMPQKQNPVASSAMIALAQQSAALRSGMTHAAMHTHQRDGAAWFNEWMLVPQIVLSTASALKIARTCLQEVKPNPERMAATLKDTLGIVFAESLSFALAQSMPRPKAQAETKALCLTAQQERRPLAQVALEAHPDLPAATFDARVQMGQAPAEALAFVARVRAL